MVYYSRTGNTRKVASFLAEKLSAELEEIKEVLPGRKTFFSAAWQARRKYCPPILPQKFNPSAYHLVIIGTPVWAFTMASPVRSFLTLHRGRLRQAAFFCTLGGYGSKNTFQEMERVAGKKPLACLSIREKDIRNNHFFEQVEGFVQEIDKLLKK